jgi:hypothetical protein
MSARLRIRNGDFKEKSMWLKAHYLPFTIYLGAIAWEQVQKVHIKHYYTSSRAEWSVEHPQLLLRYILLSAAYIITQPNGWPVKNLTLQLIKMNTASRAPQLWKQPLYPLSHYWPLDPTPRYLNIIDYIWHITCHRVKS